MKVVLTEKPSVARELASFLGAKARKDGYFEGQGYQVTWALGHLVSLKEPHEYDPALKKWALDPLPFVPERFELKLLDQQQSKQQFATIKRLIQSAEELICATDAGREGELIFRYILSLTGCERKPFRRLWLSSLTDRAIEQAWKNLRPGTEYDNLYAAARCRSEADWIVGMNATRNYTVRYGQRGLLWSAGRVQTPVLAMIVRRDDEIRHFQPEPFWELSTRYRTALFRYRGGRFAKEEDAKVLLQRVRGHPLVIEKVERKQQREMPPLLFDLTELQREMNRRFGLSAAATLAAAQVLYEKKLITYPRTDSRYLTSDMKKDVVDTLHKLQALKATEIAKLSLGKLPFSKRILDDSKVSDHHAIIPTGKLPETLTSAQQQIYDAVVIRLIAVFYPPCLKEVTTVDGKSNTVPFRAKGVRVLDPGWTELYPKKAPQKDEEKEENTGDEEQELPLFRVGEQGAHEPFLKKGETTPPRPYSENTLLGAMETAGKQVEEERLKEALKERGLGTPATRASIIETLLKRNYILRTKKTLTATPLGRYLIALVQDPNLKSAELTGEWEAKLKAIEQGRLNASQFMQEIAHYAEGIVRGSALDQIDPHQFGACPRCGKPIIEGERGYGCSGWKEGCKFVLWKSHRGRVLTLTQIRQLLQHHVSLGPVAFDEGDAVILALSDDGHLMEIPPPKLADQRSSEKADRGSTGSRKTNRGGPKTASLGTCPLCGGEVVEQKKSFSCGQWQAGCKFVIWKTIAGKKISTASAKLLLKKGETKVLKGFRSKAGNPFSARLALEEGQVRFKFES